MALFLFLSLTVCLPQVGRLGHVCLLLQAAQSESVISCVPVCPSLYGLFLGVGREDRIPWLVVLSESLCGRTGKGKRQTPSLRGMT